MKAEHLARLTKVEKAVGSSEMSDAELLHAIANRDIKEAHLAALYRRIEAPFTAMTFAAAAGFRHRLDAGEELNIELWPIRTAAAFMAYRDDEQMPEDLKAQSWLFEQRQWLPRRREPVVFWGVVRRGLVRHLASARGGMYQMRDELTERLRDDQMAELLPVYSPSEAARMVRLVEALEAPLWDVPILAWEDPDGHGCVSRKHAPWRYPYESEVVIDGQKWTRLAKELPPQE